MNLDQAMAAERLYDNKGITVVHGNNEHSLLPAHQTLFGCKWIKRYTHGQLVVGAEANTVIRASAYIETLPGPTCGQLILTGLWIEREPLAPLNTWEVDPQDAE